MTQWFPLAVAPHNSSCTPFSMFIGFIVQDEISRVAVEDHDNPAFGVPLANIVGEQIDVAESKERVAK